MLLPKLNKSTFSVFSLTCYYFLPPPPPSLASCLSYCNSFPPSAITYCKQQQLHQNQGSPYQRLLRTFPGHFHLPWSKSKPAAGYRPYSNHWHLPLLPSSITLHFCLTCWAPQVLMPLFCPFSICVAPTEGFFSTLLRYLNSSRPRLDPLK